MEYLGSNRAGAGLINNSGFQMDPSLVQNKDMSANDEWLTEYYKLFDTTKEVPMPCMLRGSFSGGRFIENKNRTPCWIGGLSPFGDAYQKPDMFWVYGANGKYFWVPMRNKTTVSNEEWEKYFKPVLLRKQLVLSVKHNNQIRCDIITIKDFR